MTNTAGRTFAGEPAPPQSQAAPVGILLFQDETGMNAPPELGPKIANDLRQRLILSYKDVLPRMLGAGVDSSALAAMNVEQVAALGRQGGVKFVVRGGLLAVTSEGGGDGTKVSVQLYAEIISVESGGDVSVRAEGGGTQAGPAADLSSVDPKGAAFRDSALGQALAAATTQLASSVHDAIIAPAQVAPAPEQPAPTPDGSAASADTQAATADQETQQLIAQAEATLSANPNGSAENINALRQALQGLESSLATKAGLLQEGKDTGAADQEIATHKQEMQLALANLTAEASAGNAPTQTQQPVGERKDFLARVDEFAGEAMSLLQKIQELRSTLRSVNEDQSAGNAPPQDSTAPQDAGSQANQPTEQTTGTVTGVVTNDGNPVAGATVTNPETGQSTTTGTNGTFTLKGLVPGRLSQLVLTKNGQPVGKGQVDVPSGRAAIADFQTNSSLASRMSGGALPGVLASTVVGNPARHPGVSAGTLKGEVRDSSGRPVPFALVQLPGVGLARTNAQGQYAFVNVPAGAYQLTVQQSGMRPKSSQVAVVAGTTTGARTQLAPADSTATTNRSLMMAGTGTVLRGTVLDEQSRPVAAAKVSLIQSETTVSVLTAPAGTYELRDLKPGAYQVSVYKVGYQVAGQAVTLKAAAAAEQRNFQLSPVASASVNKLIRNALATRGAVRGTLRSQTDAPVAGDDAATRRTDTLTGQLKGRVTDDQGRPVAGAAILIRRQRRATTDQAGNYVLAELPPDSYRVAAGKDGFTGEEKTVDVRAGSPTRQDFVLKSAGAINRQSTFGAVTAGGRVAGRIVDGKTGAPMAGVTVTLAGRRAVTTAADGSYSFTNIAPGTYQIIARKSGFTEAQQSVSIRGQDAARANFALMPNAVRPLHIPTRP